MIYNNELYHYGVLGMKWGVRRYQNTDGTLTAAGKKRYNNTETQGNAETADATSSKRHGLSDKQKRAIKVGAAIAVGALAAYGGYKLYQSGELDSLIETGKRKFTGTFDSITNASKKTASTGGFKMLSHKESIEEAVTKANPTGSRENCYKCVVATALRMCGIDVTAQGNNPTGEGMYTEDIVKAFKIPESAIKRINSPSVDRIRKNILKNYEEGDVGIFGVTWSKGYSHVMNWSIRNGKVELFDGQCACNDKQLSDMLTKHMDTTKEVDFVKLANAIKGINFDTDIDIDYLKQNDFVQ